MVNMYDNKRIENKISMRGIGKIVLIATAALTIWKLSTYDNSTRDTYPIENATYQGYMNNEGIRVLVFDPEPLTQRQGEPTHRLLENPKTPEELKFDEEDIGQNFNLIAKSQRGLDMVASATPVSE